MTENYPPNPNEDLHFTKLKLLSLTALFVTLFIISSYIVLPIGPVPITLQTVFIFLAALLLPLGYSMLAIACYFLMGLIGLPVFAMGRSLMPMLLGPTAGFVIAFPLAMLLIGLTKTIFSAPLKTIILLVLALLLIYLFGALGLWLFFDIPVKAIIFSTLLPLVPGDIIKIGLTFSLFKLFTKLSMLSLTR